MAVSEQELQAFNEFALKQITTCGADSVEELASAWREARELAEEITQREKDILNEDTQALGEAFEDIRNKLSSTE